MSALGRKLRKGEDGRIMFKCPGCNGVHSVMTGDGTGPRWGFNDDVDHPSFTPSILVTWHECKEDPGFTKDCFSDIKHTCHSFVTDGRIQFLSDCTHSLAGQTVDIPDWDRS